MFLAIVARTIDVRRVELGEAGEFDRARNTEEVLQKLEARSGQRARRLFESFLRKAAKLEAEQNLEVTDANRE